MTNTPWILTEVHRNPDCLEWIISTERPVGATEGCKANPRIAIFDEMGGSGAGRCEGRHNALVAVTAHLLLTELRALAHLAKTLHSRQAAGMALTPPMWAMLSDLTHRAEAAIALTGRQL